LSFADSKEVVYERADYPMADIQRMFDGQTFSVIGYGTQVGFVLSMELSQ
jgi:ketol-acid reductoisomerase